VGIRKLLVNLRGSDINEYEVVLINTIKKLVYKELSALTSHQKVDEDDYMFHGLQVETKEGKITNLLDVVKKTSVELSSE
jgi:hypothetical protein